MQGRRLSLFLLALASGACADDNYRESVAQLLPHPGSARFQAVREAGDHVCGEVNHRLPQGGYSGYRRFVHDLSTSKAMIDPSTGPDPTPATSSAPGCSKPFAYQTVEERLACANAPVQQALSNRQREFDALWLRVCAADQ